MAFGGEADIGFASQEGPKAVLKCTVLCYTEALLLPLV